MGKIVNKRDLALIVGVSERTLTEYQREGLPLQTDGARGASNAYDTEQVIRWLVMREKSKPENESQRDRLARLQGDKVEMEMAVAAGQLVPVAEIQPAWLAMVSSAKSYLRAEPDRLAQLLDVTDGVDAKRDLLLDTFDEFLRKLSTYDPGEDDEDETFARDDAPGRAQVRAAAEDDGGSMG
jgi:phage terminase Nu1 subunit (DNA packaging protein)